MAHNALKRGRWTSTPRPAPKALRGALAALSGAILALSLSPVSAAQATEGVPYRFEGSAICIDRPEDTPGWRIGAAARSWNQAGVVSFAVRDTCNPALPNVSIYGYRGPRTIGGFVNWPGWSSGHSSSDGQTWLYRHAAVHLNKAVLEEQYGTYKKCWSWYVTAHELGHTLGLQHSTGSESVMSYDFDYMRFCKNMQPVDHAALAALGYNDGN